MKKNKIILNHCPNFYKITNFEYDEDDYITGKLINTYEEYIFNIDEKNNNEIKKVEELDQIILKYIEDYSFRKEIKLGLMTVRVKKSSNIIESIVENIFRLFERYEEGYTRNIYFARWV